METDSSSSLSLKTQKDDKKKKDKSIIPGSSNPWF